MARVAQAAGPCRTEVATCGDPGRPARWYFSTPSSAQSTAFADRGDDRYAGTPANRQKLHDFRRSSEPSATGRHRAIIMQLPSRAIFRVDQQHCAEKDRTGPTEDRGASDKKFPAMVPPIVEYCPQRSPIMRATAMQAANAPTAEQPSQPLALPPGS